MPALTVPAGLYALHGSAWSTMESQHQPWSMPEQLHSSEYRHSGTGDDALLLSYAPVYGASSTACVGSFSSSLVSLSYDKTFIATTRIYPSGDANTLIGPVSAPTTFATTTVNENVFIYYGSFAAQPFIVQFKQEELDRTATSDSSSDAPSNNPLSTGAKAGIGVGAALGGLILLALGVLLYRRRARLQTQTSPSDWPSTTEHKAELHNETVPPRELAATQNTKTRFLEVNPTTPAELETHPR
ncbi:hypothetical protein OPT61_g4111 [Boeremia exigua]|uniref:Uncharacterized protein n=1 Tax=Boeremia exigua TaxID=749465 RepID=A0ACC2IFA8_9PLEO|nr:hypothetical protein OPT61_g4111 [Boeremia exigua]